MNEYESFSTHIQMRYQPIGRLTFGVRGTLKAARAIGDAPIIALCEDFLPAARDTNLLVTQYITGQNASNARGEAVTVDSETDGLAGALYRGGDEYRKNPRANPVKAALAHDMLSMMFPNGLGGVVQQPFEVQLDMLDTIIHLGRGDFAHHIKELNLTDWFKALEDITEVYRAELEAPRPTRIAYRQVQNALRDCHERMLQIVAKVLGTYNERTSEHAALRKQLLEPIMIQDAAVAEYNRSRRKVVDVDPETGIETDAALDVDVEADAPAES